MGNSNLVSASWRREGIRAVKRFDYMLIHSPAGVKAARERAAATVPAAKRDASKLRSGLGQLGQIATKIAYGTPLALSAFEGNINPDVPPHSNKKTFSKKRNSYDR